MRAEDVGNSSDTSALWSALVQAKEDGDRPLVRAIEARMREVSAEQRFAHLSDVELRRRIDALNDAREPTGMIGHSPDGSFGGSGLDSRFTSQHNAAIRANQHVGIEVTLVALQAEWSRRYPDGAP